MPDLRLAVPAAMLWAACALGVGVPQAAPFAAVLAALGAVLVLLTALLLDRSPLCGVSAIVAVGLATAAAGLAVIAAIAPLRVDAALSAAAAAGERVQVAMRIESTPRRVAAGFDGETRWSIRGTTLAMPSAAQEPAANGNGARRARAGVPIRLVAPVPADRVTRLTLGATASAEVSLRVEEPGRATAYSAFADVEPSVGEGPPPWLAWTGPLRTGLAGASSGTPGDGGDLLPGLAIGDETAVDSSLDAAMKASSLSHLTAVSGANCAIVTGLAFLACARIGLGRRLRIVVAAGALGLFVLLVGPGASVLRAAAMALVILIALARGRPAAGLPTLSLAAIVLLLHDPWLARDYGFALSVLATTGLLLFSRPLGEALAHLLPRRLAFTLAVPVAAQAACQPVLLLLAPGLPLYGVVANLLAAPAAPIATVLGCLACALLPFVPFAGQAIVWLAWLPSAWIAAVARFASSLPGAALPWPAGAVGVVLCVLLTIAVGLVLVRRHLPRVLATLAVIALVAAAGGYTGGIGGIALARVLGLPPGWQIAACDVGQGDALVIRDGGSVAMVDVGRSAEPAASCLDRLGIGRIALLVLTHYDADYVGGLDGVVGRVDRALVGPPTRPADEAVLRTLAAAGVAIERGRTGLFGRLGGLSWRLLWPPGEETSGVTFSGNAGSLVFETERNGLRTLVLGDLGEEAQNRLVGTGTVRPVDVVKVAHHGSADQSRRLYELLAARLGLISVGADNGYGHPTRHALDLLTVAGTAVARTDRSGMLLVSPGADGPLLWVERPAEADARGRPYPRYGQGGMWPPEHRAEPARADRVPRRSRSRSCPGARSGRLPSCSYPARRVFSPTGRCVSSARPSVRPIPAWRSATFRPPTTPRGSCSHSRAPPSSANRG
ncbi:hypothetical protein O159_14390 [Leifsonia xyli subsp. cynodontis DSM 46306]|uniref:Metallo-beta-lactamase domain-containing protein n=1 Tax=Leifsonia xyli subsp. cynodontis DSM 46306 TaxID=1389489 RepID=U3P9C6_LEIXC|nr:hypothetical protein O159_14390 [Leifsonia xyli subsp. cynodontis DSM 46306]